MKIKLLIGTKEEDYLEHISKVLSEQYEKTFDVTVVATDDSMNKILHETSFDVALMDVDMIDTNSVNMDAVKMPIILYQELTEIKEDYKAYQIVAKYQRISKIVSEILQKYSEIVSVTGIKSRKSHIVAVWSPCGGVGKTTVALAYAANRQFHDKSVLYLNLEKFSSVSTYFPNGDKSISLAFEKLDSNLQLLLQSIKQKDSSGIYYFAEPNNYDDINILSIDDIETLVESCATEEDELIIDLSSVCDEKVQKIFDMADTVLIVVDATENSKNKIRQYLTQNNVAGHFMHKSILVKNKDVRYDVQGFDRVVKLPLISSINAVSVYKTLSADSFDW